MTPENEIITVDAANNHGGKIVFASDVIATIANLAATEIEGVDSMSSTVVEGISGMLSSKKGLTRGVKVEASDESATVTLNLVVKYGYKIHEICEKVQLNVKNSIETMTGLTVHAVNISVQSIAFEKIAPMVKAKENPAE